MNIAIRVCLSEVSYAEYKVYLALFLNAGDESDVGWGMAGGGRTKLAHQNIRSYFLTKGFKR